MKIELLISLFFLNILIIQAQSPIRISLISGSDPQESTSSWLEQSIQEEVKTLLRYRQEVEFEIVFCNYDVDKVIQELDKAFTDPNIDMIIASGPMSSIVLSQLSVFNKPSIATIILDKDLHAIPVTEENTSGVNNFTYVQTPFNIDRDLRTLHRIFPFKRLGVVGTPNTAIMLPILGEVFGNITGDLGAEYIPIPATGDRQLLAKVAEANVDAVYVLPVFGTTTDEEVELFFKGINDMKLPSMALVGESMVNAGAMLGYEAAYNLQRIPRRIALNISKILDGANPADLDVTITTFNENLLINMAAARAIEVYPNWDELTQATLLNVINEETDRTISLKSCIAEALESNLVLKGAQKNPLIAEKEVQLARSELLPQLGISTSLSLLDERSASFSFGTKGRANWLASGSISQVVLSEPALANVAIQSLLQQGQEEAVYQTQLDVVLDVATAFLGVLQAKSFVNIQNENVKVTKNNYDISKAKEAVGYSGASDLNRWASELALKNIDLTDSYAQLRQAMFNVNQILNRSIKEVFQTEEISLTDQMLAITDQRIIRLIHNHGDLEKFADFLVVEAMNNLPELKQIDYNIAAQERLELSQKRAFYLPSIALSGDIDYTIKRIKATPVDGGTLPDLVPTWNVGLGVQYPIFQGGARKFQRQQTELNILQLEDQRGDLHNQLEFLVRSNLEFASASYTRLELSKRASEAALANFNIVQDSYSQGQANITSLIDAQNTAIQTELQAVNAVYQFVLDFLEVERSVGSYYLLMTTAERDAFFERLAVFLAQNR